MKNIIAVLLLSAAGCASVTAKATTFKDGAVTCVKAQEPEAIAESVKLIGIAAADLLTGKGATATWADVKAEAESFLKTHGIATAACALDGALAEIEAALHPGAALSARALASFEAVDDGRQMQAEFNAEHGVTGITRE